MIAGRSCATFMATWSECATRFVVGALSETTPLSRPAPLCIWQAADTLSLTMLRIHVSRDTFTPRPKPSRRCSARHVIINIYHYRGSYSSFTGLAGHELDELKACLCVEARMPKVLESSNCNRPGPFLATSLGSHSPNTGRHTSTARSPAIAGIVGPWEPLTVAARDACIALARN